MTRLEARKSKLCVREDVKFLQKHFKSCQKHAQIGFIPKLDGHLGQFPCQPAVSVKSPFVVLGLSTLNLAMLIPYAGQYSIAWQRMASRLVN